MSRSQVVLLAIGFATSALCAGCLNDIAPGYGSNADKTPSTVGGAPIYAEDLGHAYQADPTDDGGAPMKYTDLQADFDRLGCTTSSCHGGTQVPVLVAMAQSNTALLNYYDLLSGCADGVPDPSDCIDTVGVGDSLLLTKTCAASSVPHMGGKPFADASDPTYVRWQGWIAAGAPY